MVDKGLYFDNWALVAKSRKLRYDLVFDFIVINDVLLFYVTRFNLETKINNFVNNIY